MSSSLRSENLTISLPYEGCEKDCKYCISKMTGYEKTDTLLMARNIEKVKTVARNAGVNSILFTGKGEPLYNGDSIKFLTTMALDFAEWPLELQTNGLRLLKYDYDVLLVLKGSGIDAETPLYNWNGKRVNAGRITTFNECGVISENRMTPIPKDANLEVVCLMGCAVPTGLGVIFKKLKDISML